MNNEELVHLYQIGNKNALDELVEQNKGMVYKLAKKFYTGKSFDIEDLEQEGSIGLMIAARKYDFNKNVKFITYATHWIYSRMSKLINNNDTQEEVSLNTPCGNDKDSELLDIIEGENLGYENIEEKLYIEALRIELENAMWQYNTLEERDMLKLHYGWDCSIFAIKEIGEAYSLSDNKIKSILIRALNKLRRSPWAIENVKRFIADGYIDDPFRGLYR